MDTNVTLVKDEVEESGGEWLLQLLRLAGWRVRVSPTAAVARRGDATVRVEASSRPEAVLRVFEAAIATRQTAAARAA